MKLLKPLTPLLAVLALAISRSQTPTAAHQQFMQRLVDAAIERTH